jgi:putative hydrolase of HD superfamily
VEGSPNIDRDVELLYELGSLRHVPRTWKHFMNPDFANLAEHHLRVTWIALVLVKYEHATDTAKIMKMAIVHDIAESRTGDVNYLQRQYAKLDEHLAIHDMLGDTSLADEFLEVWEEYEKRESIEAKIVKDADNIDVDLELMEQATKGFKVDGWKEFRQQVAEDKLYTDTARRFMTALKAANPHAWHINGRNRINGGDWKRTPEQSS